MFYLEGLLEGALFVVWGEEGHDMMNSHQWDVIKREADDILSTYDSAYTTSGREAGGYLLVWDYLGYAFLANCDAELVGWTVRHKPGEWLLVVKVMIRGAQMVGFMSASTTAGCVQKLLSRLSEGNMSFYPDKFA